MKKSTPSAGKRIATGFLVVAITGLGVALVHEETTGSSDRLSSRVGQAFNHALLAVSRSGMSLTDWCARSLRAEAKQPDGMIALGQVESIPAEAPRGIYAKGEPAGFLGKQSKDLHRAFEEAFATARNFEAHGK